MQEQHSRLRLDWVNTPFLVFAHLAALAGLVYLVLSFSWWTLGLAVVMMGLCGLSITGGYHRLFSHPTYKARWPVRLFYLLFGAASLQNSALKWSSDHRTHHAHTDKDEDPYSVTKGFWWSHIGWVFFKDSEGSGFKNVRDLEADVLVRLQHRYYIPVAILVGFLLPVAIASLWGDPLGGLLVGGFVRLVVQYHSTFSVNSFAHILGRQPYSTAISARDSFVTALITLGEGYHNFHHRFQSDYRNGVRWYQFDPTKWFVWSLSKVGLTWDLRRTPQRIIDQARRSILADAAEPAGAR